jgi:hypothetical protein
MAALRQSQDGSSNPEEANCQGLRFESLNGVRPRQGIETPAACIDVNGVMRLMLPTTTVDTNSQRRDSSDATSVHLFTNLVEEIPKVNSPTRVEG